MFRVPPSNTHSSSSSSSHPHRHQLPIRFSSPPSSSERPLRYSPNIPAQPQNNTLSSPTNSFNQTTPPVSKTTTSATFDIRKLYHREKTRDDHRQELYDSVVRKIHHRVETVAQRKETTCLFNIPQFILGMPLYDPFQCTGYVIQTLKAQGFHVKYFHPNTIFIDWSRHLIEPYVNAMNRREASKQYVLGATDGNQNSSFPTQHHNKRDVTTVGPLDLNYVPSGKLFGDST